MNKDEIKLKPCPFCGTLPETWWSITQPHKEGFNITCPQCKIPTVNQIFKKESIEIWNDRPYISQNDIPKERVLTRDEIADIIFRDDTMLDDPSYNIPRRTIEACKKLADALIKAGSIERKEISVEEIEDIIFSGANTIDINPESSLVLHQDQFLRVAKAIKDKLKGDKITKEDVQPLIDKIKNS